MNVKSYVSLVKSKSIWTNMPHDGNWTKVKARWAWIWLYLQFTASLKIFQFRGDWQLVSIVPCNWTIHLLFRHMGRCLGSHLRLDSPIPWTMCEMMNHGRCMHGPTISSKSSSIHLIVYTMEKLDTLSLSQWGALITTLLSWTCFLIL